MQVDKIIFVMLSQRKKDYSKFGSYTGNGNADGTFVYTGFKPAFVITKSTSTTGGWYNTMIIKEILLMHVNRYKS
jgi:hypothetical protein